MSNFNQGAILTNCLSNQGLFLDLSGEWQVELESGDLAMGEIQLPASLAERGWGTPTVGSDFGVLTPEYKYVGQAWYCREIEIPDDWAGREIELFLERVLWESRVQIDGRDMGSQDALGTPHIHRLGQLSPGWHTLSVRVDNRMIHNLGDKGHAYGAYTQSIWNGIVGRIELRAYDPTRILDVQLYSNLQSETVESQICIQSDRIGQGELAYEIYSISTGQVVLSGRESCSLLQGETKVSLKIPTQKRLERWSEFTPEVYGFKLMLTAENQSDQFETEFGFCEFSHDGTKLLVNGQPVFLRGNLDCVHFPLTGYPSCNLADWEAIFRVYKEYGFNHARFHSWCPPEAAFRAANRAGIYLQAEASVWIDWWMSEDMVKKGRPHMDTLGHPQGLGKDPERDQFVVAEMERVVGTYGNHPSFVFFCIGNELGNSDFSVMDRWITQLKAKDPRRLYAASTAREINPSDDYCATHYLPGIGQTRGLSGARTDWDFDEVYTQKSIPLIAHEIGQWPVHPQWAEIKKYTGMLKARNLEALKALAQTHQDVEFSKASGALNQILYKYEIESFLRTAHCAGIQLLSMQDYPGQGEALIGWLDAHWESKGITTSERFREHFAPTVPLLRMKKFIWTSDELFEAQVQLSHHGAADLEAECRWVVRDSAQKGIAEGTFGTRRFKVGSLTNLGTLSFNLKSFTQPKKLSVSVEVVGTEFKNHWPIWVYPAEVSASTGSVHVLEKLDIAAEQILAAGGKVLLLAHELGTDETAVKAQFYPLYWSLPFFPGQGKTTIGLLLQNQHPAFVRFPTASHSDWQWESISSAAKGFILNHLPDDYRPIAQPIDDFHRGNKIGSIFELRVGQGSLLVCGYPLETDQPVARQLKASLLDYMNSPRFSPQQTADLKTLQKMLPAIPKADEVDLSEPFQNALLFLDAAHPEKHSTAYTLQGAELSDAAWCGKQMVLEIDCPEGMLGTLYVHLLDHENAGRIGLLEFEGRRVKLGLHAGEGKWIAFHVMREDSNNGKLTLKTTAESDIDLRITQVVLVSEA